VEHAEHLVPVGDTLEYLADGREVHERAPSGLVGRDTRPIPMIAIFSSALPDPSPRPPLRPVGSRAGKAGRSFTLDAAGGHAAGLSCSPLFPFLSFSLPQCVVPIL